jgi:hypothetical protein
MTMRKEDGGYIVEGFEHQRFRTVDEALQKAEELMKEDGQPCYVAQIVARVKPKVITEAIVEYA